MSEQTLLACDTCYNKWILQTPKAHEDLVAMVRKNKYCSNCKSPFVLCVSSIIIPVRNFTKSFAWRNNVKKPATRGKAK